MTGAILRRASTFNETCILENRKKFILKHDLNNNSKSSFDSDEAEAEKLVEESSFAWAWPFCTEGLAHGAYLKDKFLVCLPFNKGGTGERNGTTRKFERIAESGLSWSMGLSRDAELGSTCFWRLEIEIHKNLNSLVLIASRDISRYNENTKRLKRVRKVYKLPDVYDVSTTTTTMYDWAVVVEAQRRKTNRPLLKRTETKLASKLECHQLFLASGALHFHPFVHQHRFYMNSYVVAGLAAKSLRENHEVAQQLAQLEEMREKVDYQMLEIYNLIDEVKRFETHEEYGKVARQLARRWQIVRERAQKNRKTSPKRSMSMSRNFHDKRAPRRENEGHNRPGRGAPRRNDSKTSFRKCSPLRDPGPDLCDSSVSILSTASDFPPGYNSSAPRKGILKPPKEPPNNEGGLTYQTNFTWKSPPIVPKSDGMTDVPFAPTHEKVIVIPPEKSPDALATPFRTGLSVEEWRNTFASMKNLPETRPSSALNPRDPRLSRGSHSVTTAPSSSATSEGGYGSANRPISQGPLLSTPVNVTPSASITSENGYRNLNRPVQQVPPSGTNYPPSPSVTPKKNFASYNRSLKQMPPAGPVNVNTASSTASKNSFGAFNSPAEPSTIESLGTIKLGSSGGQSFPGNKWNGRQNGPNFRVPGGPMNRPPHFKKRLAHPSGPGGPSNPAPKPRINIGFKIPFVMPDTSRPPPPITRPVKHLAPVKQYYHEVAKPDSPSTPVGVVPYRPNRTPAKKNIKMDVSPSDSVPVVKEETDSDGEIFDVENDDVKVVVSESVTLSLPPIQLEVPVAPSLVVHKEPVTAVKTVPPLVLSGIFKRAPPAGLKRIPKLQKVRPSIPRLYDLCEKACEKSARGSYYGRVPFHLLAPLLEKYSTKALYEVEITMPWLEDEINGIWMKRLRANFPAVKHFPGESFGQAYRRCVEELEDETTEKLIRSVMEARMKPKIKGPKKAPVRRKRQRNPPGAPRQKGKRAAPCT